MVKTIDPNAKSASGGKEVVLRCRFCGDSSNPRHAHFYMSVPQSQDELSLYHCKRCSAHGLVDDSLLRKIGCSDSNILVEVIKHNREVLALPKYKSLKKINIYPLRWNLIRKEPTNQSKLDYINNRLGLNLTYADLASVKIFLNLYDIIQTNNLELTRHKLICDALDKYFIGFISYDNSYCGMRKCFDVELHQSINKRYINYSLVNKPDDAKNFYVIPSQVDVLDTTPVRIHIAEGQFDILSIFFNLNNGDPKQSIYIACGGKSYSQALEFVLLETGIINYEVHFYPDKDVSDNEFNFKVLRNIRMLPTDIYIHRNTFNGEKDYGVPSNRITDSFRVIRE
jgi:hypothetical protein